jgi:enamine deaminase RidA (YjgF/YER057c/UK114 family)
MTVPKPFAAVTVGSWPDRYTFSPAVRVGHLVFISGTTASDERGQIVGRGDVVAQTRHIYRKFEALLAATGASLADIVETTEYVTTTENYKGTAEVRREVFGGPPYPTATGVIVAGLLREGALIEISAVAVLPEGRGTAPGGRAGAPGGRVTPRPPDRTEAP